MKDEEKETWRLFERYALKTHENFYFAELQNPSIFLKHALKDLRTWQSKTEKMLKAFSL
eukprot:XP_762831.1 hypothetical protein [Theileria parva strain Muguga]